MQVIIEVELSIENEVFFLRVSFLNHDTLIDDLLITIDLFNKLLLHIWMIDNLLSSILLNSSTKNAEKCLFYPVNLTFILVNAKDI